MTQINRILPNATPQRQKDIARVQFLRWVAAAHPEVYRRVAVKFAPGQKLGELGFIQAIVQAVLAVGSTVLAKKQNDKALKLQKQQLAQDAAALAADREQALKLALLDTNTKRAQAGLPPVDINGKIIGGALLPMPSALAPIAQSLGMSSASIGYIAAAGAAAIFIIFLARRRR